MTAMRSVSSGTVCIHSSRLVIAAEDLPYRCGSGPTPWQPGTRRTALRRKLRKPHQGVASSVFKAPRMFMTAKHTCSVTSAGACSPQPHAIHSALLSRNSQKPALRRPSDVDATNHDAMTVTAIAGHWTKDSQSTTLGLCDKVR